MALKSIQCFDITSMLVELDKENKKGGSAITAIDISGSLDHKAIGKVLGCEPIFELEKKFKFLSMCKVLSPRFIAEICIDMFFFKQHENKKAKHQFVRKELEKADEKSMEDILFAISAHIIDDNKVASKEDISNENPKNNSAIITTGQYKQDKNQLNILALDNLCKSVATNYPQKLILLDPFNEVDIEQERHKLIYNYAGYFDLEIIVLNLELSPADNEEIKPSFSEIKELIKPKDAQQSNQTVKAKCDNENAESKNELPSD